MKKTRKTVSIILIVLLFILSAGCGNNNNNNSNTDNKDSNYNSNNNSSESAISDMSSDEANGLIVCKITTGKSYTYSETGSPKCRTFTAEISVIDMNTGKADVIRRFSSEETHSCSTVIINMGNRVQARKTFDKDMRRMVATLETKDGATHVGWLNEDGSFTDVSAKITTESDFGALTCHGNPCFGDDNYFYYRDETNDDNATVNKVPIDDLSPSSVEVVRENTSYKNYHIIINPDGSVDDDQFYYFDSNKSYAVNDNCFQDWISENECVGKSPSVKDMIFRYTLSGEKDLLKWKSDAKALVPSVTGRVNYSPRLSPDKSQVAFLSKLTSGTDDNPYLYTVSSESGDPKKINTDYSFAGPNTYLIEWV